MSKRALLISVVTAMAVITAGCDEELPPVDADSGMMQDGGSTGDVDAGMTGDVDSGMTGDEDGGTGDEDGGTGDEDGGTGDEDGGMTGDVCGDGVVTGDETCDSAIEAGMPGACPASCNDGLACTTDTLVGAAATCDAECTTTDITACTAGDGCCPSGCTTDDDDDCACTPRTTCTVDECGMVDDGCGNPLDCGACATGGACTTDADCAGDNVCLTEAEGGWTGGYCTIGCYDDSHCDTGTHCVGGDAATATVGLCMPDCTTNSDCRTSGYSCRNWDSGSSLECAPSATGTGAVGAACTSYADCAGADAGVCVSEGNGWQNGYCTVECTTDSDCGAGAHCLSNGFCFADCTVDSDCRAAGYGCFDVDLDGASECWPSATGTGAVGDPCDQTFDCAGGARGECLQQDDWGIKDGACTLGCTAGGTGATGCPAGSHCGGIDPSTGEGMCLPDCTTGSCRADGYLCYDADGDSVNECWGAATGTGVVGAACAGTWDCAGGLLGFCFPPQDSGLLPGGYCTMQCDTTPCPSGNSCVELTTAGDLLCVDDCTSDAECRTGYSCVAWDATVNACL